MTTAEEDGGGMLRGGVSVVVAMVTGAGLPDRWYLWSLGYYLPTLARARSVPSANRDQTINDMVVQCKAIGYRVKLNSNI